MKKSEYERVLQINITTGIATCLWGDPGSGKTEFVKELAKNNGMDMIHINCNTLESTDLVRPTLVKTLEGNTEIEFIPCSWVKKAAVADKPILIFLDELNRIKDENQDLLTTLVLEREVYGIKLSKHIEFVAAANFQDNCSGVKDLDLAVMSRFAHILFELPLIDSIPYMGSELAQQFLSSNAEDFEIDSKSEVFCNEVLSAITESKRSITLALRACQHKDADYTTSVAICTGLLGEVRGASLARSFRDFANSVSRKVPATIVGYEDKCSELLEQGMVTEITAVARRDWDRGNKDAIANFSLKRGNPEFFRSLLNNIDDFPTHNIGPSESYDNQFVGQTVIRAAMTHTEFLRD